MARFEEASGGWTESRRTQEEAARLLGVCDRTFRRWLDRYEDAGRAGLLDKRRSQGSGRWAPVDEVLAPVDRYRTGPRGGKVQPCSTWSRRAGGGPARPGGSPGCKRREWCRARRGGGRPARVERRRRGRGCGGTMTGAVTRGRRGRCGSCLARWTMRPLNMTRCSLVKKTGPGAVFGGSGRCSQGRGDAGPCTRIAAGTPGTRRWGGKVDKRTPTQFGRAMAQLGIELSPAYAPEARGRSERAFRTSQDRLVKARAAA